MDRMDAPLVNVFVSELVKFKTGVQSEGRTDIQKPQPTKTGEEDGVPKMTNDELTQLQDQMRKVMLPVLFSLLGCIACTQCIDVTHSYRCCT